MDITRPFTNRACIRGFSLIELVVLLGIIILLLSITAPAANDIIRETKLSTQLNTFAANLNYARSEAVKSGIQTQICKSPDGENCDNGAAWHDGWIVFADENNDRQRSADEPLLQTGSPTSTSLHIDYGAFPTNNYVVYYPSGISQSNGTFTFCDGNTDNGARALVLYKTGRLRSARTMPDGSPIDCP